MAPRHFRSARRRKSTRWSRNSRDPERGGTMFELTGKRALVTGASGAIGGAIARAFHAQGASVALSGTKVTALEALAAELGDRVAVTPADLGKAAEVEKLVPDVEAALGGEIDILVNNAGMTKDMLFARMS